MIVTCPECHTQYKLDPQLLGAAGRTVRCTACFQMWTQKNTEKPQQMVIEAGSDDIGFQEKPKPPAPAPTPVPDTFEAALQQAIAKPSPIPPSVIPEAAKPMPVNSRPPVIAHKPGGMGAGQAGFLTFLLCLFVSLISLFLMEAPVVRHMPAMSSLYSLMGFDVKAPGEGLKFSDMIVERRIDQGVKTLAVEAKLENISEKKMTWPAIQVTLKGSNDAAVKQWTTLNKEAKVLAPGEATPVKLSFDDAPDGGTDVDVKIVQP